MEFWPIYVLLCCAALALGVRRSEYTAYAPTLAAIVAGVVAMRYTNLASGQIDMLIGAIDRVGLYSAAVWAVVTGFIARERRYLTAFLIGVSALAYIPFVVANIGITRLGVAAIASDIPLAVAILVAGNGCFGNPVGRVGARLGNYIPSRDNGANVAQGAARDSQVNRAS